MALEHINDLDTGIVARGKINDTMDDVDTNTANIATNTTDIATNASNIALKQTANAFSTLRFNYDNTQTGNYTLLGADTNKVFDITNVGASTFTLPPTATIAAFATGAIVLVINNASSSNNIVLTAGVGVTVTVGNLSATLVPGVTAMVMKIDANRYHRIF